MATDPTHSEDSHSTAIPIVNEAYLAYVASGGCPMTQGKTWCNQRADRHAGPHYAMRLLPNGTREKVVLHDARDPRQDKHSR